MSEKMQINITVPRREYILVARDDWRAVVDMLQRHKMLETFKALNVKGWPIAPKDSPPLEAAPSVTQAQARTLHALHETRIVPRYKGKAPVGNHGFNRNVLRALVGKGLMQETKAGGILEYRITDEGYRWVKATQSRSSE